MAALLITAAVRHWPTSSVAATADAGRDRSVTSVGPLIDEREASASPGRSESAISEDDAARGCASGGGAAGAVRVHRAGELLADALALARRLSSPFDEALALFLNAFSAVLRADVAAARTHTEEGNLLRSKIADLDGAEPDHSGPSLPSRRRSDYRSRCATERPTTLRMAPQDDRSSSEGANTNVEGGWM
jgi:hypothetical protein